ncbi:MAG TPA: putative DNA-binding protein [Halanaerobiales bacterium]|nr:putative DNA-binding protein [Halanaerobiales bacterium]
MLDKTIEISMLFDYYGKLLTDKQQKIIDLYYYQDLSLGEIAENLDISRQGVYDHLNRAENTLKSYEDKLQLVKRNKKNIGIINELIRHIKDNDEIENKTKNYLLDKLKEMNKNI